MRTAYLVQCLTVNHVLKLMPDESPSKRMSLDDGASLDLAFVIGLSRVGTDFQLLSDYAANARTILSTKRFAI